MLTIISSITFLVSLLVSYFAANVLIQAADEKYNILEPFQSRLLKSKKKKLIKRYFLFAAFAVYVIISNLLNFNDLESGISLGIWASFIMLVYKPFNSVMK